MVKFGNGPNVAGSDLDKFLVQYDEAAGQLKTGEGVLVLPDVAAKNMFANGILDVWQRGAGPFTSNGYTCDGIRAESSGSSHSVSQQTFTLGQTTVPYSPRYYRRNVVTSSAGAANYSNDQFRIEGVEKSSGRSITVQFWAKADTAKNIAIEGVQNFGTGGSPSSAVNAISPQLVALTTGWVLYSATLTFPSVSGKTLGSNGDDYFGIIVWMDAGSDYNSRTATLGQQSGTFDMGEIQIEDSGLVSAFEVARPGEDYARCRRYLRYMSSIQIRVGTASPTYAISHTVNTEGLRATPSVSFTAGIGSSHAVSVPSASSSIFTGTGDGQGRCYFTSIYFSAEL